MIAGGGGGPTFTTVKPPAKPRCYMEFCCNTATHSLIDYGDEPFDPDHPTYRLRGVWGWCPQHRCQQ